MVNYSLDTKRPEGVQADVYFSFIFILSASGVKNYSLRKSKNYSKSLKTNPSTIAAATASATAAAAAAVAAFITENAAPTTAAAANTSAASNAAAAVFQARTEAALATRLPDSAGSLFESLRSGTDEGQWARVQ